MGRTFALAAAREGAKVAVVDINLSTATEVASSIQKNNGHGMSVKVDVANEHETLMMASKVADAFGRIDVLVNNAAFYYGLQRRSFDEIPLEEWDKMFAVNAKGCWLCCRAVFPYMKKQGRGKIVNLASAVVFSGAPNMIHYVASKGAVVALTRALAKEVGGYGINVNAIAPGLVMTEASKLQSTPDYEKSVVASRAIKRLAEPEDVVGTLLFLSSDASDFVTGQTMLVDGGMIFH